MSITNLQPIVNLSLEYDKEYFVRTMKVYDKANLRTDSSALSPYAFLVLLLALSNVNTFKFNERFFISRLPISKPTLIKALSELESKGYLYIHKYSGKLIYVFSEIKKGKKEFFSDYEQNGLTILRERFDRDNYYKRIPKRAITYNNLSVNARRLLIFGNACSEGQANVETFKHVLKKTSSTTIYSCIKELMHHGFVTSCRKNGSNKYIYSFSWGMLEPKHASGE